MTLQEYLEKRKVDLKLTDDEIGARLGISGQLFGLYRRGKRNPKIEFYQKWKNVFRENIQTFVSDKTEQPILVEGDFHQMLGKRTASIAAMEAMIKVLRAEIVELKSAVTKRPYAEVALEFDRAAEDELAHILERLNSER